MVVIGEALMDPDVCLIEEVQPKDSVISPILVNFDYGRYPEKESSGLQCDMFVDHENHLRRKLLVTRSGQTFIGKLPVQETPLCQSLLVVRNKKTNKARIMLMQSCNLVNASKEKDNIDKKRLKTSKSKSKSTDGQKLSAINFLKQNFGSKKSKRVSEMGLRINLDLSGREEEIRETVSNVDVKMNEINTDNDGNEELLKLIPPCNRDAKNVRDVYDINDIINGIEREALKLDAEFLMNNGLTESDQRNSPFLYSHYKSFGDDIDIDKVILLIYANTLLKFYNLATSDLRKKNLFTLIHPTSRPVAMRVLNDFTILTKSGRSRSSFYKDKVVCYLMVIILLFSDYKINLDTLPSCLNGFSYKKLSQLARVVGLVPMSSFSSAKIFLLKVPLPPLPKPRMPKKRATVSF